MKREFTNENFEEFLKRSADSLRMKAPDKVWQNLSRELNKRRRRWIFGLSAFLLIGSASGYFIASDVKQENQPTTFKASQVDKNSFAPVAANRNQIKPASPSTNITDLHALENSAPNFQPVLNSSLSSSRKVNAEARSNQVNNQEAFTNEIASDTKSPSETSFTPTVVDSYTEFDTQEPSTINGITNAAVSSLTLPLTIESVINSYKSKSKKGKFETQIYFTPTVSYRKLTENKSYLRTLDPASIPANFLAINSSVNSNVTHKPDVGFELGFTAKIPVSKKLKLRTGIQFNVNRYDIKAFRTPMSIATIALSTGSGVDSLSRATGYSNVSGYKSNWLQNLSFQLSAPVGIEYNLGSGDKVQFGLAATIQPTYVLGDRAFLISTDYKNYTQVPWLIRRWNVNTAFETFVKYKNWQVGPQVRYQLLSSFISQYPVKENLFDFGLKVGLTLK